jgi:Zn ribbon nucleic-acid-binding protein
MAPGVICPVCQSADVNVWREHETVTIMVCNHCGIWFAVAREPQPHTGPQRSRARLFRFAHFCFVTRGSR